jgi:predicted O-methyltransferase YrrM
MLELYCWARGWPNGHIVELGTRRGVSTSALLAGCEVHGRGHVWSFDIDPADVPQEFRDSDYWTFTQTDGLGELALDTAPREIEVLFIDLDPHSFEQTLTALTLWVPRIVPGGVALLHDTEWPEINYVRPGAAESEVGRALDVYCTMKGLEWRNKSGCNGLGILRVR